jgi:GNAT superfamily N-acetyltransferase
MTWRLKRSEFEANKGQGNKDAMRAIVDGGQSPGILGYQGGLAVGWCAVAPRTEYPALARSRVLKPIDSQSVWSVSCLFVQKESRGAGVSVALLKAAVAHVKAQGGHIVEGYPVEPKGKLPAPFVWTGLTSAFLKAGFTEAARGSASRPIMRVTIG